MIANIADPCMVVALRLLNFYILGVSRLHAVIITVALQGVLLGLRRSGKCWAIS